MVAKKESAEQKLLQMIEASSGASEGASPAKKLGKKSKMKMNILTILSLCSKILMVLLIVSIVFLFREINIDSKAHKKIVNLSVGNFEKRVFDINSIIPNFQNFKYYLSAVSKRNIFKPYVAPEVTSNIVAAEETSGLEITRLVKKLRLVGISWMDRVETASVMIEDIDKKLTYFLQKGEKLNEIIIKTIYADSALLGYKDEEIIIKYEKSKK